MQSQVLNTARLGVIPEAKAPPADIKHEVAKVTDWSQVTLPGCVLQHLARAGSIPDPFKDFNSRQLDWVAKGRFVYLVPFKARKKTATLQNAFLVLDGIDTFARVYLNGRLIMRPANAFCRWEVDVTAALRWGNDNLLIVVLDPLIGGGRKVDIDRQYDPMGHPERLDVRRCQMTFGADFFPPLLGPGIRRGIRVDYRGPAWIEDLWVHTIYARREAAYMEVKWRVRSTTTKLEAPLRITLKVDKEGEEEKIVVPVGKFRIPPNAGLGGGFYEAWGHETVTWANPPLWFPHTHGEPKLHDLEADLRSGGVLWDRRQERYGLRVVEIERKPAPHGRQTMRFLVNGIPVFARGAVWTPADGVTLDGEPERLGVLLRKTRSLRMNMLRVWAGGQYESEDFYRLCDEMGILVWQDFPFLNGPYPFDDQRFLANVKYEATDNLRRLRRHPSLAVLCGNSGVAQTHRDTPEWNRRGPLPGESFFNNTLSSLCDDEAPHTPYLPGSPSGGDHPNEPLQGDHHAWTWWNDIQPPERILKPVPSFLSAFGVPTAPDPRTIDEFITQRHRHLASGIAEHTIGNNHNRMLKHLAGENPDAEWNSYLARGWELQARVVGDVIERLRVGPEESGGALLWTLNEPFPGCSWSVIDSQLRPKPAAFRAQQACADILMRFVEEDRPAELRILNDRPEPLEASLRINLVSLDGDRLYEKEMAVQAPARGLATPWREALEVHTHLPRPTFLVTARLEHPGGVIRATYFPVPVHKLLLPRTEVLVTVRPGKQETVIQFRAAKFVRWVLLEADTPGNGLGLLGFDLIPGEPVLCGLSPQARRARVRSLSPGLSPRDIDLSEKQSFTWNG